MNRSWIAACGLAALVILVAGNGPDPEVVSVLDPGLRTELHRSASGGAPEAPQLLHLLVQGDPDPQDLELAGARIGTRSGSVLSVRVARSQVTALASVRGVRRVQLARPVTRNLDLSVPGVNANDLRMLVGQAWTGLTGEGVVVGIVDSGLDVTHADFLNPDGSTRVVRYWDQGDSTGFPPSGLGFGSEWTDQDIDGGGLPAGDLIGHGTHVTGIAVGNGRGSDVDSLRYRYAGIAPNADIVVVSADQLLETGVLDGVNYVFQVAAALGKPAVVNLSLGSQFGPHDGTGLLDLGIDGLVGPGRIAVASAGNEGDERIHAELHVPAGGSDSTTLSIPSYFPNPLLNFVIVDAFYREPDSLAVTLVSPSGNRFGPFELGESVDALMTGEGTLFLTHIDSDPSSSNLQVQFDLSDFNPDPLLDPSVPGPAPGQWRVVFTDLSGAPGGGEVDLWVALSSIRDFVAGVPPGWIGDRYDPAEEVATPGSATRAITVGSYNSKDRWPLMAGGTGEQKAGAPGEPDKLTFFSSRGPTRDDRLKPEVVAPGFVVASALSAQMTEEFREIYGVNRNLDPDGQHFVFAGTSMSAPHVAGALALVLETSPDLTPEEARARIRATARQDVHTGSTWNASAGFGKLDVKALVDTVVAVVDQVLLTGTTVDGLARLTWGAEGDGAVTAFRMFSSQGEESWEERGWFRGRGPHEWIDATARPGRRYRLMANSRTGESWVWAEAIWQGSSTQRPVFLLASPNPFRTRTLIGVAGLEDKMLISGLEVYDSRGRRVRRVDGLSDAETGVIWDGRDDSGTEVSAGVYWARVRLGEQTRNIKLVRVR